MNHKTQSGFALVAALVAVVSLALVGFIAWRIYDAGQQARQTNQQQKDEPQDKKPGEQAPEQKPQEQPVPNQNIIKIPDLSVQITVPDSLRDLTFRTFLSNSDVTALSFSTSTLTNKDSGCSVNGNAPPLGALSRRNGQYSLDKGGILKKQFTSFYIVWLPPQATCTEDPAVEQSTGELRQVFNEALKSIEEIKN